MRLPDWDSYAKLGMLQAVIDQRDGQGFKNRLIDRIEWNVLKDKLRGSKRLLDFGCGTGRFASRVVNMGIEYTGIDSCANMIQMARQLNKPSISNFIHSDGLNIPFPDGCFDTCITCGVLQYIINGPNTDRILSEIRRVLTPGGRLTIIEQASLSNQTSGTVPHVATEADYIDALSKNFFVKNVQRVRSCLFSALSKRSFLVAKRFPWVFCAALNYLAKSEIRRIQSADETYLSDLEYYEVMVEGIVQQ